MGSAAARRSLSISEWPAGLFPACSRSRSGGRPSGTRVSARNWYRCGTMRYTGSSKAITMPITISARTSGPAWRIQRSVAVNRPTGLRCSPISPLFLWPCWRTLAQLISDPLARREQPVRNIKIPFVRSLEVALFIAPTSVLHWIQRNIGPYSICSRLGVGAGRHESLGVSLLVGSDHH